MSPPVVSPRRHRGFCLAVLGRGLSGKLALSRGRSDSPLERSGRCGAQASCQQPCECATLETKGVCPQKASVSISAEASGEGLSPFASLSSSRVPGLHKQDEKIRVSCGVRPLSFGVTYKVATCHQGDVWVSCLNPAKSSSGSLSENVAALTGIAWHPL